MNPYDTFWRRAGAYLIDALIFTPLFVMVAIAAVVAQGEEPDPRILGVASFAVPIYRILMHRAWGATVGKMATGIVVVDADTRGRLTLFQSIGREAPTIALLGLGLAAGDDTGPAGTLNVLWLIGDFISVVARKDRRAAHDLLAGTVALRKGAIVPIAQPPGARSQPFAQPFGSPPAGASWPEPPPGFGDTVAPPPLSPPMAQPAPATFAGSQSPALEMPAYQVNYGTPAGALPYQNFWRRFGAAIIDRILLATASQVVALSLGAGGVASAIVTVTTIVATEAYPVVLVALRGQTVGKMALGIKVVRASDNEPAGWVRAFIRRLPTTIITVSTLSWLLFALSTSDIDFSDPEAFEEEVLPGRILLAAFAVIVFNGGWYLANLITVLVTERRQAVYDLMAGTAVIRVQATHDPSRFAPRPRAEMQPPPNDQEPPSPPPPPPRAPRGW